MKHVVLTENVFSQINSDMKEKEEMLTDAEVNALAIKVNNAINLPIIGEKKELRVFVKIIKWVDKQLYKLLPNEYYGLVKDATDGVTKEEALVIEERLTPLINEQINIPVLSEKMEAKLIGLVLGMIMNAMVKGFKLEEVKPES
jgi:hypothetical protein